jgi:hypothetical protein
MRARPIISPRGLAFTGAISALLFPGCASKPPSGGPGTYRGVIVDSAEIGSIEVTVGEASSGPLPASGTISLDGATVSLSGTLDRANTKVSLSSTDGYQLDGDSRPAYVFGSFHGPQDKGSFALFLEGANSSPIRSFCGSFVWTSPANPPSPFAVAATSSGSAMCVGPNFMWFGNLDAHGSLSCEGAGNDLALGNVDVDAGNNWGTGNEYGSWTVAPCGAGAVGVPDGGSGSAMD